ncbi:MAG: Gfo/Idh/MocA family oxidoreductase [Planctomycetota bacterium]
MEPRLRLGILGTGNIAGQFAEGVAGAQRSVVAAVGSRSADSAAAFGKRFGLTAERCHPSYEALIRDDSIEAVYVSLPNHLHAEWTIKALEAGKHVLCEKPLAMNADEATRMFAAADATGRMLMEAFMYRGHPLTVAVVDEVRRGTVGALKTIRASFCYRTTRVDGNVRFDPAIGGGALMDIGCYCLDFCRLITGRAPVIEEARIVGNLHDTGVDDYGCVILKFPADPGSPHPPLAGPITAALTFGMTVQLDNTAHLGGTDGHLQVPVPWKPPQRDATYIVSGQTPPKQDVATGKAGPPEPRIVSVDADAPLYGLEADAFADAVAGRAPLPITPDESLGTARLLETLRRQLGLSW